MSLSHLHKKQLEELNTVVNKAFQVVVNYCRNPTGETNIILDAGQSIENKVTHSTLSTLQGVLEMLEEGKKDVSTKFKKEQGFDRFYEHVTYNESLTDTQKKIEEEIIKIKEIKEMKI